MDKFQKICDIMADMGYHPNNEPTFTYNYVLEYHTIPALVDYKYVFFNNIQLILLQYGDTFNVIELWNYYDYKDFPVHELIKYYSVDDDIPCHEIANTIVQNM